MQTADFSLWHFIYLVYTMEVRLSITLSECIYLSHKYNLSSLVGVKRKKRYTSLTVRSVHFVKLNASLE